MANYVIRKKVNKTNEEDIVRYHGVPVSRGQVSTEQLAEDISHMCSLTPGDVYATISALSTVMQRYLRDGNTVCLKDIGVFSVSASSEGFESPGECTPSKVKAQRICFKADNKLRAIMSEIKYNLLPEKKKQAE